MYMLLKKYRLYRQTPIFASKAALLRISQAGYHRKLEYCPSAAIAFCRTSIPFCSEVGIVPSAWMIHEMSYFTLFRRLHLDSHVSILTILFFLGLISISMGIFYFVKGIITSQQTELGIQILFLLLTIISSQFFINFIYYDSSQKPMFRKFKLLKN